MGMFDDKVVCTKSKITDVADAIRYKLGESDLYTLDEMPQAIKSIDGGGGEAVINPLNVTANGTYTASGIVDGFSPVTVNVAPDLEDITITQNGSYKSSQHDGYDDVIVNVAPDLEDVEITTNGVYTSQSHDGFGEVTVNVSGGSGTNVTNVILAKSLPPSLVEGAVYLIPEGTVITPPIPSSAEYYYDVMCCNLYNVSYMVTYEGLINNATKFWLYRASTQAHTKSSQIQKITWGSGNNEVMPSVVYEYDKTGSFEWVDITQQVADSGTWSTDTSTAYQNGYVLHDLRSTFYSNHDIARNVVGNNEYLSIQSLVNISGKIDNIYLTTNFQVYLVQNGIAVSQGIHDLRWVVNEYTASTTLLNNVSSIGESKSTESEESKIDDEKETIEEKTDDVKEQKKESVEKASELDA